MNKSENTDNAGFGGDASAASVPQSGLSEVERTSEVTGFSKPKSKKRLFAILGFFGILAVAGAYGYYIYSSFNALSGAKVEQKHDQSSGAYDKNVGAGDADNGANSGTQGNGQNPTANNGQFGGSAMNCVPTQGNSQGQAQLFSRQATAANSAGVIPLAGSPQQYQPNCNGGSYGNYASNGLPPRLARYDFDRSASSVMVSSSNLTPYSQSSGNPNGGSPNGLGGYSNAGYVPSNTYPAPPYGNMGYGGRDTGTSQATQTGNTSNDNALGRSLVHTELASTQAAFLGDRDFVLDKGSYIKASLDTRIDSSVPGFVTATVTRNVWSANGHIVLIERGSKMSGEYQNGVQQGQRRVFVLWTRVTTPSGVVINLDSPATDGLGGSGVAGNVNNHFWARYGGAIMLSVVDDGLTTGFSALGRALAPSQTNNQNNFTISTGNTQSGASNAAQEIVRQGSQIKPSLYLNQGATVGVYIARDMDFARVYGLRKSR
jgi:Bacterial conjugation TrbI-like protein